MRKPVIAIGLDAAEAILVERWTAEGKLPNLARLMAGGAYGRTQGNEVAFSEVAWPAFYTGCWPEKTGFWQHMQFDPQRYTVKTTICDYRKAPPFYALGDGYTVAAIDLPQVKMSDGVNGLQLFAWGAHSPLTPTASKPAEVMERIKAKYGMHPALNRDHARPWRKESVARLQARCLKGIELRRQINKELLAQDRWDLFLTIFSETHSVTHYSWHVSQTDHPLHEEFADMFGGKDPVLEIYQKVDEAIGDILGIAPAGSRIVIFSQEGMQNNNLDLPNYAFLPEIMYRMCFPGQVGIAGSKGSSNMPPPDPVLRPLNLGWVRSVYSTKADDNFLRRIVRKNLLMEAGYKIEKHIFGEAPGPQYPYKFKPYWSPGMWFSPYWPKMRAFALPSQGDGFIRINLQGRERDGIVPPKSYDAVCQEVEDVLMQVRDARTQKPVVTKVIRTRSGSQINEVGGPQGDLCVKWDQGIICDVVDSPTLGRIGPLACRRSGGHNAHGFFIAQGADIPAGMQVDSATWVDVAPMILELMGAPVPDYMDGRSPLSLSRDAA